MHSRLGAALVAALTTAALLPAAHASAATMAPTKSVKVAYGDGPVVQDSWDQVVRVAFRGKAGDRVALQRSISGMDSDCESVVLENRQGEVDQRASGFHVLPSSGRYQFSYSQACWASGGGDAGPSRMNAALQLLKLEVRRLRPDATVRLPERQGYVTAARVWVGKRTPARALRAFSRASITVATPSSQRATSTDVDALQHSPYLSSTVLVERGAPLQVDPAAGRHSVRTERGSHLFYVNPNTRDSRFVKVRLSGRLRTERATLTSRPLRVGPRSLRRLEFRGRKGQWVRLDGTRSGAHRLSASPGRTIALKDDGLWQLPATRTYRLDVVGHQRAGNRSAVRRLVPGQTLVAGEAPAEREIAPDQWSVFPVRADEGSRWFFTVAATDLEHGWSATAHGDERDLYQRWYAGCLSGEGVGENSVVSPSYVVVRPGPGSGGSLTMGFQDQPASPQPEYPEQMCWW